MDTCISIVWFDFVFFLEAAVVTVDGAVVIDQIKNSE